MRDSLAIGNRDLTPIFAHSLAIDFVKKFVFQYLYSAKKS